LLVLATPLLAGCSVGTAGPILANPPAPRPTTAAPTLLPSQQPDPIPVELPRDDAPHDRLTEWWYYTGHLEADDGSRYGFEFVVFRVERGGFPVAWASHIAVTDEGRDAFHFAQRVEFGPQVDQDGRDLPIFRFRVAAPGANWEMAGSDGHDTLLATTTVMEAAAAGSPGGLGIDLELDATKPPALHDGDGWVDFGAGGSSYYYSRTAMDATGSLTLGGRTFDVTGSAWFDHQWGDFIAVGGGGWDWFAINLDDGTDLMLSLNRDIDGSYPIVYGTLVDAAGRARNLAREAFAVEVTDRWLSPRTGADYPAGWRITIPGEDLEIVLSPTVADQELDTRATTSIYWEGSQVVEARRGEKPLGGEAYVELTGYASAAAEAP
jgi:predicted secreted hydrolase